MAIEADFTAAPHLEGGFALTDQELSTLKTLPEALSALADWHEEQATVADSMMLFEEVGFHDARKRLILAEMERRQREEGDG